MSNSLFAQGNIDEIMKLVEQLGERDLETLIYRIEKLQKEQRENDDTPYPTWLGWNDRSDAVGEYKKPHVAVKGYVYLLRSIDGHYKIGKAIDPEERIGTLEVKLPFEIVTEHLIPCADYSQAESTLHKRYASKRVRGEWFALTEADVQDIRSITEL